MKKLSQDIYRVSLLSSAHPQFRASSSLHKHLCDVVAEGKNQYGPMSGDPELVSQLRKIYSPFFKKELSPEETAVTCEHRGVFDAFFRAFMEKGDEFVSLGPCEKFVLEQAAFNHRVIKETKVHLRNGKIEFDFEDLNRQVNDKTRFILVGAPGLLLQSVPDREKLIENLIKLSRDDLAFIFDRRQECLLDPHHSLELPEELFKRSISLYSAGPAFSVEDWALGWVIGSPFLIKHVLIHALWMRFCPNTPAMAALARHVADLGKKEGGIEAHFKSQREIFSELFDSKVEQLKSKGLQGKLLNSQLRSIPLFEVAPEQVDLATELGGIKIDVEEKQVFLFREDF